MRIYQHALNRTKANVSGTIEFNVSKVDQADRVQLYRIARRKHSSQWWWLTDEITGGLSVPLYQYRLRVNTSTLWSLVKFISYHCLEIITSVILWNLQSKCVSCLFLNKAFSLYRIQSHEWLMHFRSSNRRNIYPGLQCTVAFEEMPVVAL